MRSQKLIFIKCLPYFRLCSKHLILIPLSKTKHALSVLFSGKWGEKKSSTLFRVLLTNLLFTIYYTAKKKLYFYQKEDRIIYKDSQTEMSLCFRYCKSPVWLIQRVCVCVLSHVWLFVAPWTVARLLCPWNFSGKNTGVSCGFLLQGIFPTRGWSLRLLCLLLWLGGFFTISITWEALLIRYVFHIPKEQYVLHARILLVIFIFSVLSFVKFVNAYICWTHAMRE